MKNLDTWDGRPKDEEEGAPSRGKKVPSKEYCLKRKSPRGKAMVINI